jgi:hypothetical protein
MPSAVVAFPPRASRSISSLVCSRSRIMRICAEPLGALAVPPSSPTSRRDVPRSGAFRRRRCHRQAHIPSICRHRLRGLLAPSAPASLNAGVSIGWARSRRAACRWTEGALASKDAYMERETFELVEHILIVVRNNDLHRLGCLDSRRSRGGISIIRVAKMRLSESAGKALGLASGASGTVRISPCCLDAMISRCRD